MSTTNVESILRPVQPNRGLVSKNHTVASTVAILLLCIAIVVGISTQGAPVIDLSILVAP